MKFSHTEWGLGSSQDIRRHIRSCDSVFVSCHTKQQRMLLHSCVAAKRHSVCEKLQSLSLVRVRKRIQ